MLPMFIILLAPLLAISWLSFSNKELNITEMYLSEQDRRKNLFFISVLFLAIYITSLDLKIAYKVLPVIFLTYALLFRKVVFKTDWLLILLFIIIFIDFHVLSTVPLISETIVNLINLNSDKHVFLFSVITSQVISNVPASVFVSKFSHNWLPITYGVNIGGNGLVIGSLANFIALRIAGKRMLLLKFHKYSIPYLFITCAITYMLLP